MTQFKVGDRVRLTGASWNPPGDGYPAIGDLAIIRSLTRDGGPVIDDGWCVVEDGYEAELVEDQPNRTYYEQGRNILPSRWGATPVDPDHYKFPGGAEVIHISQWLTANAAQALQYVARSSRIDGKNKGDASEDIRKAITFLEFELKRLEESQ